MLGILVSGVCIAPVAYAYFGPAGAFASHNIFKTITTNCLMVILFNPLLLLMRHMNIWDIREQVYFNTWDIREIGMFDESGAFRIFVYFVSEIFGIFEI